jgi:hypothetical protein
MRSPTRILAPFLPTNLTSGRQILGVVCHRVDGLRLEGDGEGPAYEAYWGHVDTAPSPGHPSGAKGTPVAAPCFMSNRPGFSSSHTVWPHAVQGLGVRPEV